MSLQDLKDAVAKRDAERGWSRGMWNLAPPKLADMPGRVFLTPACVTLVERKERWVDPGETYYPFTAGELAREWLGSILGRAGRERVMRGSMMAPKSVGPALFFDPPKDRGGEWVMIDVKAAYWTLYSRLPLDCIFGVVNDHDEFLYRAGDLYVPEEDKGWVGAEKALRNAAWGSMLAGRIEWWENGRMHSKPSRSRFEARGLTQAVLAQMNAAAAEARELGAVMWLTDAAICRREDAARIGIMLSRRWGLLAMTKAVGSGYLYGLGDYWIGDSETAGEHTRRGGHDGLTRFTLPARDRLAALA